MGSLAVGLLAETVLSFLPGGPWPFKIITTWDHYGPRTPLGTRTSPGVASLVWVRRAGAAWQHQPWGSGPSLGQ